MSLINDALKQARAHTENGNHTPNAFGQPPAGPPRRSSGRGPFFIFIVTIAGILIVAGTAGVVLYALHTVANRDSGTATLPQTPLHGEHQATVAPAATASMQPAAPTSAGTAAPSDQQQISTTAVASVPAPPAILPATEDIRAKYELKGIMKTQTGFMALLNSTIVYEGDFLRDGAQVMRIAERSLDLKLEGQTYRLMFFRGGE